MVNNKKYFAKEPKFHCIYRASELPTCTLLKDFQLNFELECIGEPMVTAGTSVVSSLF